MEFVVVVAEIVTAVEATAEDHNGTGNEAIQIVSIDVTEKSDKDVSKSVTAIGEVADELWSDEQYDQMSEE